MDLQEAIGVALMQRRDTSRRIVLRTKRRDINTLLDEVVNETVPKAVLKSATRRTEHVNARYLFMYLAQEIFGTGPCETGRILRRDHSTVLHGLNRAKQLIRTNDAFKVKAQRIASQWGIVLREAERDA